MSDKFGEKRIEHGMIQEKTSKDITYNKRYNYINEDIVIDFELSKTNKEKVLELSLKGNEINNPEDIIKNPYVFEFLVLPENKPLMESDLEESLIKQIEKFILELRNIVKNKYVF